MSTSFPSPDTKSYSLDVPPRLLILQEIQQVTAALRRNPRWSFATSSHALNAGSAARTIGARNSAAAGDVTDVVSSLGLKRGSFAGGAGAAGGRPKNVEVDEVGIIVALVDLRRMVMIEEGEGGDNKDQNFIWYRHTDHMRPFPQTCSKSNQSTSYPPFSTSSDPQ